MKRRTPIGRQTAKKQPANAPPSQEKVSVAVLPANMVRQQKEPPTEPGNIWSEGFMESRDWQGIADRGGVIDAEEYIRDKSNRKKTKLQKIFSPFKSKTYIPNDLNRPPYIMRQVSYDTWRNHYAKDADGNYHGLSEPAEDCLLKPADMKKWRPAKGAAPTIPEASASEESSGSHDQMGGDMFADEDKTLRDAPMDEVVNTKHGKEGVNGFEDGGSVSKKDTPVY